MKKLIGPTTVTDEETGWPRLEPSPSLIYLYLPNGDVDIVKGATNVFEVDNGLRFVDRDRRVVFTKLPYTVTYLPEEEKEEGEPHA